MLSLRRSLSIHGVNQSNRTTETSLPFALLALAPLTTQADPLLSSWYTEEAGTYARIYQTQADEFAGTAVTTWNHGQGNQAQPTYAGVHQIDASNDWVYVHTTGLAAGHVMGPWYLNAAKTQIFPNYPSNISAIFSFPRLPTIPLNKTPTPAGAIGYFVDGVAQCRAVKPSRPQGCDIHLTGGFGSGAQIGCLRVVALLKTAATAGICLTGTEKQLPALRSANGIQ